MKILWIHKEEYDIQSILEVISKNHRIFVYDDYFEPWAKFYPNYETFDLILADIWGTYNWIEYDYDVDSGIKLFNKIDSKIPFIIVYKDSIDLKVLEKLKEKDNTQNLYFLRRPYSPSELLSIVNTIVDSKCLINSCYA